MRTYVVVCNPHTNPVIAGVTSSKRYAVQVCEKLLCAHSEDNVIWENLEKDSGVARCGEMMVTFQRYVLNDV